LIHACTKKGNKIKISIHEFHFVEFFIGFGKRDAFVFAEDCPRNHAEILKFHKKLNFTRKSEKRSEF
jgi:hypothetical protein